MPKSKYAGVPRYDSAVWLKLRRMHLRREPYCRRCKEVHIMTLATVVDHIKPHRGNPKLFFDENNMQSLCVKCHNQGKQQEEKSGRILGADSLGRPTGEDHPWNRPRLREKKAR